MQLTVPARRWNSALLPALVAVAGLLSACGDETAKSTPTATTVPATPTVAFDVSVPTEIDIGTGPALVWGTGRYGVVLVHGAIYDAASWTEQAAAIAAAGFAVVAIENATAADTRAATDYLGRTFGVEAVGLVGASAGTGPVLDAASAHPPDSRPAIDLVVILAGSGNVDQLDVASVLFISAEGDGAAAAAKRMLAATSGAPADLLLVPGSAHAQALFNEPEGEQVLSTIVERLTERQRALTTEP